MGEGGGLVEILLYEEWMIGRVSRRHDTVSNPTNKSGNERVPRKLDEDRAYTSVHADIKWRISPVA